MTLHHADCFDILPKLPSRSIDFVCCDLPYGTTQCKWDTPIDLKKFWQHISRVAKPNAAIALFAQTPFDKVLGCSNLPILRYELVWEKGNATGHLNSRKMPLRAHENILVFYSSLPTYNPQKTQGHERKTATKRKDVTGIYSKQTFESLPYDSTERYPRSVLKFSNDKQRENLHPTQKPLALLEWLVLTYSHPGDTVMDVCMGSGTTGVACHNLGRNFIGIEKDKTYFDIAKQRITILSN